MLSDQPLDGMLSDQPLGNSAKVKRETYLLLKYAIGQSLIITLCMCPTLSSPYFNFQRRLMAST